MVARILEKIKPICYRKLMPLISVIIPTHNRLESLKKALDSVRAQSFKDYDIWVVDDASTDGTAEYLKERAGEEIGLYFLISPENKGVSYSRNLCIKASSGKWLALLDSDDQWLPNKLAAQIALSGQNPDWPLIHTEEAWIRDGAQVKVPTKYKKTGGEIFDQCFELCRISPSTAMIRREIFNELGFFREDFPVCEDFEMWLRITRQFSVGLCPDALTLKFGGHEDQLSRRYHSMDYWRVLALAPYLKDDGLGPEVSKKLREVITAKCRILLKGYERHKNFVDQKVIADILGEVE